MPARSRPLPRLIVLVGPKGSGKSTLGRLLGSQPGVRYLDVEPLFQRALAQLGGIGPGYARAGFDAVYEAILEIAEDERPDNLVFETTGTSEEAVRLLDRLASVSMPAKNAEDPPRRFEIRLVRVRADLEVCTRRRLGRDAAAHVPVSEERIRQMHAQTEALDWDWHLDVDNSADDPFDAADRIRAQLRP